MHNPIVMVEPADRDAGNAAMSEIYGFDAGQSFRDWRGVSPGGAWPPTLLYCAPGLEDDQFDTLAARWPVDFPGGVVLDATPETCSTVLDAYCAENGLAIASEE